MSMSDDDSWRATSIIESLFPWSVRLGFAGYARSSSRSRSADLCRGDIEPTFPTTPWKRL